MKYMLLCNTDPEHAPVPGTPEQAAEAEEWFAFTNALAEAGVLLESDALQGAETATTLRIRDGVSTTTDGPFLESKEVFGGYYIIDVDDLDSALHWAAKVPLVRYGSVEVRPVLVIPGY